jgi:uncharacterized membrane protein YeaQ/YmgE (transglycosylase-associated protein family)
MSFIIYIVVILVGGLIVGGLARLAVPGPDPMSLWATALLGIGGSLLGGVVFRILFDSGVGFLGAIIFAILILLGYRHYVQKRPIWGPGARRPPT